MSDKLSCLQFIYEFIGERLKLIQFGRAVQGYQKQRDNKNAEKGNYSGHKPTQVRFAEVVTETHSCHGNRCEPHHIQEVVIVLEPTHVTCELGVRIVVIFFEEACAVGHQQAHRNNH